jgi:hypothetical protein
MKIWLVIQWSIEFMIIDKLTLITGAPIFIQKLGITIFQPKMKEIGFLGEEHFFKSLSFLFIKKEDIPEEYGLENFSDFEIFLELVIGSKEIRFSIENTLQMMISELDKIIFNKKDFILVLKSGQECIITSDEFSLLKEVINQIFRLNSSESDLNPANAAAKRIADKLKKRRQLLSSQKEKNDDASLSNVISILAVGSNSNSIKDLENCTLYQLLNIIERFGLYEQHKNQVQAMMQGAENIDLVDWYKKI